MCFLVLVQPPLAQGDGPIALIMAPTRELVVQIGKDVRRFCKALNLTCVCAYGGSAVAGQISELKRGAEVSTAATPVLRDQLHLATFL
jgi:ATP-dependent RNA helicase DDX46/PRP5